jgi:hypothetical protein
MKNPKEKPKQELPQIGTKEFNDLASIHFGGKPKQAERMYSEEEVEKLIHRAVHDSHCRPNRVKHANSNECAAFVNEWLIEQFKKK